MMKPLRKRHLHIWTVLAIIIPICITGAWWAVPKEAKDKLLQPASAQALPIVLKPFYSKGAYEAKLRTNSDTTEFQLEWINKQTLTYPTATIYRISLHDTDIAHRQIDWKNRSKGCLSL
jgi:hypothetical protein